MERSRYKFANSNLPHFMTCTAYFPEGIALDSDFHPSGNSHNTIGVYTFPRRRVGTRKHTKQIEVTNSGKKVVRTNLYFFINLVVNICLLKNKLAFSN